MNDMFIKSHKVEPISQYQKLVNEERLNFMNIKTSKRNITIQTIDGITISGIYALPETVPSRALIICLHGGGANARIFDETIPHEPGFIDIAASLGYSIIALDRPGYGASADIPSSQTTFDGQTLIFQDVLNQLWEQYGSTSAGIFLVGHSIGGMISLCIAAANIDFPLLGVSTHGIGVVWQPGVTDMLKNSLQNPSLPTFSPEVLEAAYGPEGTWDRAAVAQLVKGHTDPKSNNELKDALTWIVRSKQISSNIKVPLQMTVVEKDILWSSSPDALEKLKSVFSASPFTIIKSQKYAGHQLNANFIARAFYLRELSFVEECIVYHQLSR